MENFIRLMVLTTVAGTKMYLAVMIIMKLGVNLRNLKNHYHQFYQLVLQILFGIEKRCRKLKHSSTTISEKE